MSNVMTATEQLPEHRCSECGVVVIPGGSDTAVSGSFTYMPNPYEEAKRRAAVVLHGCAVETIDPDDPTLTRVRCGRPATWWTAPNGTEHFVCPEHQESFDA